jgi:lysophospholipase L1-like esterase
MPYPTLRYTNPATGVDAEVALQTAQAEEARWSALIADSASRQGQGDVLVLALRWPLYFDPGFLSDASLRRTSHFDPVSQAVLPREQALARWIEAVGQMAADHPRTPIVLLLPTPEFGDGVPAELCREQPFRPTSPKECMSGVERRSLERFSAYLQRQLAPLLAQHRQIVVHDPLNSLCPPRQGRCPRLRNGFLLYSDGDHLSRYGASLVLDDLVAALRRRQLIPPSSTAQAPSGAGPSTPALAPSAPAGAQRP